eukprot:scaffold2693_cov139-Isochrysis_galbana.AAC.11
MGVVRLVDCMLALARSSLAIPRCENTPLTPHPSRMYIDTQHRPWPLISAKVYKPICGAPRRGRQKGPDRGTRDAGDRGRTPGHTATAAPPAVELDFGS